MGEETIKKILKNLQLTDKETEVYIFLSKYGVLKCNEIAKGMKRHKAQIYRILKILQTKGLLESTLEAPTRFTAVPFETVLDLSVKAKRDEAAQMELAKNEILTYWKSIRQPRLEPSLEKFVVIEGYNKIYPKIFQMIRDAKNQLSAVSTVPGLLRADQFGLFDAILSHPLKSKIQFRFLADLPSQNLNALKTLLKRIPKTKFNFKCRNPDLMLQIAPRMVIRDAEEIIFFITPRTDTSGAGQDELCLWTNCKELVHAFTAVFEDSWRNSTDIEQKIMEIETGKPTPKTFVIGDAETARKKYEEHIGSAGKDIMILTSSKSLVGYFENIALAKKWAEKGVSVRIMSPITTDNLTAALQLSKYCAVRHVSASHLGTTIVDEQHLFQFKMSLPEESLDGAQHFKDTFYSSDREYVEKTKTMLNEMWENALVPSAGTLKPLFGISAPIVEPVLDKPPPRRTIEIDGYVVVIDEEETKKTTEKAILNKIMLAKKEPAFSGKKAVAYMTSGSAIIRPPSYFNLPDLIIEVNHYDEHSSWGEENTLTIYLWLETPKGYSWNPVSMIQDNPRTTNTFKKVFSGTPMAENIHLVRKDELEVRIHGNTLFTGWTVQIPLLPKVYDHPPWTPEKPLLPKPFTLPPACLLIEGYGKVRTHVCHVTRPTGYNSTNEANLFNAFVTFIHPASKYSGPGTDGVFARDLIITTTRPLMANSSVESAS